MTPSSPFKSHPLGTSVGVLVIAMISIQIGSALAKQLFPAVGPSGAVALRLAFASVLLFGAWRPWRLRPSRREAVVIVVYGLAMGWMNFFFYLALDRVPLGIAVALEFTGPLAVALLSSRRWVDFVWVGLAAAGLLALLPFGLDAEPLSSIGVGYALAAGACWALYIVVGQRAGGLHAGQTVALGTLTGALVIVPIGLVHDGAALFSADLLPVACGVALLSGALPYSLEMLALTRLPVRTFGVLMSLEPALGALSGRVFLGEHLTVLQWVALACIMAASAGSAAGSRDRQPGAASPGGAATPGSAD